MQNDERDLQDRTKRFALSVIRTFSIILKTTEAQVLGKQMLRSGTSVGANYREAYRGRSRAEFIAKCGDSLREWKRLLTGLSCYSREGLSRQKNSQRSGRNVTS
jgi:four helix bundle protein